MAKKDPINQAIVAVLMAHLLADKMKLSRRRKPVSVLGVDPSTSGTGYCSIKYTLGQWDAEITNSGVITQKNNASLQKKMETIFNEMHLTIRSSQPDVVAVEEVSSNQRFTGTRAVSRANGACFAAIGKTNTDLAVSVNIQNVKRIGTGVARIAKEEVVEAVNSKWGTEFDNDNVADAFSAAMCAVSMLNMAMKIVDLGLNLEKYEQWDEKLTEMTEEEPLLLVGMNILSKTTYLRDYVGTYQCNKINKAAKKLMKEMDEKE